MAADVENRSLISRLGGLARSARYDGRVVTEDARRVFRDSFTEKARLAAQDAGEPLSEQEILRRGEALRRLHYSRLALASVKARTKKIATASTSSVATLTEVHGPGATPTEA